MTKRRHSRLRHRSVASLGALSILAVILGVAPAGAHPQRLLGERIIYTTEGTFGGDAWAMWPNGTGQRQLALEEIGRNGSIAVSPTGTRLAYTTAVTNALPPALLPRLRRTFTPHPETAPTLALLNPIRFVDETNGGFGVFYQGPQTQVYGRPAWTPGGRQLAISVGHPGALKLALDTPNTDDPIRDLPITGLPKGDELNPAWSPDGRSLVFQLMTGATSQLYTVASHGGQARPLTTPGYRDTYPSWSPTSETLVFSSNRSGLDQLFEITATGQDLTQITHDPGNSEQPAWSPDGKWIAYTNDRDLEYDIFRIRPDGTDEHRLTTTPGDELVQGWQPLYDTTPPRILALPSSGKKGGPIFLKYRTADDSGTVFVSATASWGNGRDDESGDLAFVRDARSFDVTRRYRLSRDDVGPEETLPATFRFCIVANDRSGNRSNTSCNTYHGH